MLSTYHFGVAVPFVALLFATLLSAFFLGLYDLCAKHSVRANAVTPVFFFSTLTGALVWGALLLAQAVHPGLLPQTLVTDPLTGRKYNDRDNLSFRGILRAKPSETIEVLIAGDVTRQRSAATLGYPTAPLVQTNFATGALTLAMAG